MALILASGSPRRRELMSLITPEYTVITSELDETKIAADSPAHLAKALATAKARAVAEENPDDVVCGFDTVVECEGEVFGKPKDEADAVRMLRALSGREHRVHTGVCICRGRRAAATVETTVVHFSPIAEDDLCAYVRTPEPYDKAGALDSLYREAKVESVEYGATVDVVAVCNPRLLGQLKDYIEGWQPPKEDWE